LVELYADNNNKITNVSMMKTLKILHASGECGIDQNGEPTMANMAGPALPGINGLGLVELYAGNNKKINNVSMISSLKILHAQGNCGIDQNGINGLELVELNAMYNKKITNRSFQNEIAKPKLWDRLFF
jgi:hypothetical protein